MDSAYSCPSCNAPIPAAVIEAAMDDPMEERDISEGVAHNDEKATVKRLVKCPACKGGLTIEVPRK